MDLDLVVGEDDSELIRNALKEGDRVRVRSRRLDQSMKVSVTHLDDSEIGGRVETSVTSPLLEVGDHVHFEHKHVLELISE